MKNDRTSELPCAAVVWESAATVLAGDYLLGQASRLIAEAAPELAWSFSDWLGELASLRADAVTTGVGAEAVFASLFEFPLRIGAALAGVPAEPFRDYGAALGRAFLKIEDVLALRGERTRLDATLADLLDGRISALPVLLSIPGLTADSLPPQALPAAVESGRRAQEELEPAYAAVDHPVAQRLLRAVAEFVTGPVSGSGGRPPPGSARPAGSCGGPAPGTG
jgi:geranylgeranyl pyrophosphate synthase